jgi:two-component system NtrC family sensor kinase
MDHSERQMDQSKLFELYRELRAYVGWDDADVDRLATLKPLLEPAFHEIIDDFYEEVARHPNAVRVITGGEEQIARLKQTLRGWLSDLFSGPYDEEFVERRFRVGQRHVEIRLDQFYANVAMSRIRGRLLEALAQHAPESTEDRDAAIRSLNRILDLDMAIIDVAYQREFAAREQRQERLATLGRVSGGIAHELRNPLNAVKTSVYYLLNAKDAPSEKVREHLERIDRQVVISDNVITALSRFARLPVLTLRPVDLCDLVEQTLDANPLPENIELEQHRPESCPHVAGDQEQLVIVLGNLIRNACDVMPDGGRLTLSCKELSAEVDGGPARFALSVTDTGCGIAPNVLPQIMEPLFSTKTRGLGLGLSLAHAIVKRHDSELSVTSEPGRGTTFTMTLNIVEDPA